MDTVLVKSRYKIAQVLRAEDSYAAFLAVDVESRDKIEFLLNVYEGALSRRYAGCFERLQHCREFQSMFIAEGALVTVFSYRQAVGIDDVFYKGAKIDWRTRLEYAHQLMHLALSTWHFPPEISCAAFLSENLKILREDMRMEVNYIIPPLEDVNGRELIFMLSDQIRKTLIKRFEMCSEELEFLDFLEIGDPVTVPVLYSKWLDAHSKITAEYERLYSGNMIRRVFYFVSVHAKRWLKKYRARIGRGKSAR